MQRKIPLEKSFNCCGKRIYWSGEQFWGKTARRSDTGLTTALANTTCPSGAGRSGGSRPLPDQLSINAKPEASIS